MDDATSPQKDNEQFLNETLQKSIGNLDAKEKKLLLNKLLKDPHIPSSSAFYGQKLALEILPDVQEMIRTGNLAFYAYEDSPYKPTSLRIYLFKALAYLADYMDEPDDRYKKFRASIKLKTVKGKGVLFIPANKKLKAKMMSPNDAKNLLGWDISAPEEEEESLEADMNGGNWKFFLFEYLETAKKGDKFEMNFALNEEDKSDLSNTMMEAKGFALVLHKDKPGFIIRKVE